MNNATVYTSREPTMSRGSPPPPPKAVLLAKCICIPGLFLSTVGSMALISANFSAGLAVLVLGTALYIITGIYLLIMHQGGQVGAWSSALVAGLMPEFGLLLICIFPWLALETGGAVVYFGSLAIALVLALAAAVMVRVIEHRSGSDQMIHKLAAGMGWLLVIVARGVMIFQPTVAIAVFVVGALLGCTAAASCVVIEWKESIVVEEPIYHSEGAPLMRERAKTNRA